MKADTITLVACGSVAAAMAIVYLYCLCFGGNKKKQITSIFTAVQMGVSSLPPPAQRPYRDVERGGDANHQSSKSTNGAKDGGMVILVGAGAAFATASVVATQTSHVHGGGGGDGSIGGGGGACGGNDGAGCAGGGCGGCGGD